MRHHFRLTVCSLLATLCLWPGFSFAASVLDIGTSYRLRGISLTHPAYGDANDQNFAYYSQRVQAHVGGRFSPNIEFMTQLQALSVAGSSNSVVNPAVNQAGTDFYPNTNFTPWMQLAYLKARRLYDMPVDLTVGRQSIMLGDGFLLSDDDRGFTGIRIQAGLPWYDLQSDIFTFKVADGLVQGQDTDLYGAQITKPFRNVRFQLLYLLEHDGSGSTPYVRPSENASTLTGSTRASRITRSFYDARIEGRLLEGGFYKGEFALQNGHVRRDAGLRDANGNDISSIDLSGFGMLIAAGLYTKTSKYGPIEVHGVFGLGTGDSGDTGKDSSFHPSFGHRVDGMERSGFGEFYGATVYDAIRSSSNASGLPPGFSGVRVIGGGVTTHPTSLISLGIDYFVYNALETANSSFPVSSSDSSLGSEFDVGLGFAYTSYLTFRSSFAFFSPGGSYLNRKQAHRFLIEAIGRF